MPEVSQKQLEANRENAKLGGVKTEEGKAISKYNAMKHGLLSNEVLLGDEDEEILAELENRIRKEIKPFGEIEILIADRIITNIWRLKRLLKVEATTMEWQRYYILEDRNVMFRPSETQKQRNAIRVMIANDDTESLLRYESAIERSIYRSLHELQRIQAARAGEKPPIPMALDIDVSQD